jgi:SAM-dependent methyltransferase
MHKPRRAAPTKRSPQKTRPEKVSQALLDQAVARKDLAALRRLADAAEASFAPDLALAALAALEELGEPQRDVLIKKRAQILVRYGRAPEAVPILAAYLADHPQDDVARLLYAEALYRSYRRDAALVELRRLHTARPDDLDLTHILGIRCEEAGFREEADALFAHLMARKPYSAVSRVRWAIAALSRCPATESDHDASISRFLDRVHTLTDWWAALTPAQRRACARDLELKAPFTMTYWPGNITEALRLWGAWVCNLYPPRHLPTRPERPAVRLLLFTSHARHHSVYYILLHGLVRCLDRRFFELVTVSHGPVQDNQTEWVRSQVARFYGPRPDLNDYAPLLDEEAPDVLFFPDMTTDSTNVSMAARRWAPLQITTWGHPASSGLPTIDLFFSGDALEPEDSAQHYVEKLIRLPGVGANTPDNASTRLPLPPEVHRLFADGRPVALVPAYAFKLIPRDDALWLDLAQRYPELRLVFFQQSHFGRIGTFPVQRIRQRFTDAGLDPDAHLTVLEKQPIEIFLTLLDTATLYLDVPSFSGYTTAWSGVFAGIPIVTLKGRFLRQRLAAGLLETIGCADTVVESKEAYVAKVGELLDEWRARPADFAARRARIKAAAPMACNDLRVVRAFERVLLEELAARGNATAAKLLPEHRAAYPQYHYDPASGRVHAPSRQAAVPVDPSLNAKESPAMTPPTTPNPAAPTTQPVWRLLDQNLHLVTLSHSYAPVGLLEMITTPPRAVFDLGCFVGGTGRWLKERFPGVKMVGIELLPAAAEKARAIYDQVFTGRFEALDLAPLAGQFDAIVAADVLEHLYHPWQALERLKTLLAPGGALYVSLPNVRNLRVVEGLALGDWPYAGAGILDITHLRFFTRRSALRMLEETGWLVEEVRANLDPQLKAMYQGHDLTAVRNIELKHLVLRELPPGEAVEFFTLQWFMRARPKGV